MKRAGEVWCVRCNAGWCACAVNRKPDERAAGIKTACGYNIILPIGSAKREPDCPKCVAALGATPPRGRGGERKER